MMLKSISSITAVSAVAMAFVLGGKAQAFTVTNGLTFATDGFTFSVASGGNTDVGNHYHSNTGGAFGNPAGKAEVGDFFSEEVRGLSEYNLTGLDTANSAFVSFDVFKDGGLFAGDNDFPFDGTIDIVAYEGNNLEDISDYQAPSIGTVGSFNTADLSIGDILNFDLTSIFNNAIAGGSSSLGIRLQLANATDAQGGAWTFDDFRLTTEDKSVANVPEPNTALALAVCMGVAALRRDRKSKNN